MANHGFAMERRIGRMGHMVAGFMVGTSQTRMMQSKLVGSWIHLKGGVMTVGSILVMVQRDCIVITFIIYIGVRSSTFQRNSRNKTLLHLMEK